MLDRNLPGFADRYEQVAHTSGAPMSGSGTSQRDFASGSSTYGSGATFGSGATGAQTPYTSSELGGSPADATTIGGGSSSMSDPTFHDPASRDAGARDPS
jgi:hypothetical protein